MCVFLVWLLLHWRWWSIFSSGCFYGFVLVFSFQQFYYDVIWCTFFFNLHGIQRLSWLYDFSYASHVSLATPLSWGTKVILYFPHCINHLFILFPTVTVSPSLYLSFILSQTFPSLGDMFATLLVQIAFHNTSLASASLSVHSQSHRGGLQRDRTIRFSWLLAMKIYSLSTPTLPGELKVQSTPWGS